MEFYVEGEAPDGGHPRTEYRGWVLAAVRAPERLDFDLLISDESSGAGIERLRTVPSTTVNRHRTEPPAAEEPTA